MPQIIAVANQKGGVGKTTTGVNLAASIVASGRRALLIDLDPQANATSSLGCDGATNGQSFFDLFSASKPGVARTVIDGLDVVAGSIDSAALERELFDYGAIGNFAAKISAEYDFVFFDTPPGLGALTIGALAAANTVLIPVQTEYLALEGLSLMIETVSRIRSGYNPDLNVAVLLTMHDPRLKLARAVEDEVRTKLDHVSNLIVMRTVIPRNVRLAEAPSFGVPVLLHDPSSPGAEAYIELAREVMNYEATDSWTRARCDFAAEEPTFAPIAA